MNHVFFEVTLVIALAATLGMIARFLRQPTILGYIATGLIVGPLGLMRLNNLDAIDALAEFGIAFLLFLVGLEIDLNDVKTLGSKILLMGLGQIVLTAAFGFLIAVGLGFSWLPALYLAVPLTFSSTIIVVKILSEKHALDSLHGKFSIGILLVQDLVALGLLILLSSFSKGSTEVPWLAFGLTLLKGGAALAVALAFGRWVAPPLFRRLARSQEAIFMVSLAWGLGFAALVALPQVGLTIEIGSFFAGLALTRTVEHHQIAGRVKSLRDFFLVMFFIILGSKVALTNVAAAWLPILVFSLFVIIGNPLIVMFIMALSGYRMRTAFMTALSMGQVSEFGLVVVALGAKLGHANDIVVATVTAVAIISIAVNSYLLQSGDEIYRRLAPLLRLLETKRQRETMEDAIPKHAMVGHVVLIGCDRMGEGVLHSLRQAWSDVLVVDFNPEVIKRLRKRGIKALYGDISDPEIQDHANLNHARLVISTVPDLADSQHLLAHVFNANSNAKVIVTASDLEAARRLYKRGADYVLIPQLIGAHHLAETISQDAGLESLKAMREHDLTLLDQQAG